MNRRITLLHVLMLLGIFALWMSIVWANWRGWVPTWLMVAIAAVMILAMVLFGLWQSRQPDSEDALSPWRDYCVIKSLTLQASAERQYDLTLELAQDLEFAGTVVTRQFHGVVGVVLQQVFDDLLTCGGLRCEDRGTERHDGLRFQVRDR